ncbi:MAG: thiamine phosphate synthase [Xanthobacteraceae bacterium]
MASRPHPAQARRPAPRLYLVTPPVSEAASFADALAAMLEGADVAAVLLALDAANERTLVNRVKAIAPAVQGKEVALLVDGHPEIVARGGADGAHLSGIDAFTAAAPALKPERIAGCGGLTSRHDAMLAGEGAADYVMFGEPGADARRPALDAIVERVGWWSEVFEIPCVGYAASFEEIAPLAQAGAEFVALGPFVFEDRRGGAIALEDAARCLAVAETAR